MYLWVIGVAAVVALLIVVLRARRLWLRDNTRTPRPLETTQIQLYRTGVPDRFVGIVTGDLRRVRCAEAWVNSENTAMQMARIDEYSVSSIIRYEGARRDGTGRVVDDRIADELAARVAGRQQVPAGTAIVTGSGELRRRGVRYIVHVAAVQGEPGAGFRQIREIGRCVTNALAEIDKLPDVPPVRSVLFPLLGTGQGGGELRPTVEALLGATLDYFTAASASRAKTVFFLAYTDLELSACEAACEAIGLLRTTDSTPVLVPASSGEPGVEQSTVDVEHSPLPASKKLQMGLVIDVVDFGRRNAPDQDTVRRRLSTIARRILLDAGVDLAAADHQWTGDGLAVVLPTDIDPPRVLLDLMRFAGRRLAEDNRVFRDRIRLRMAVGVGLVGIGSTGLIGSMIIEISRLIDSTPLRDAVRDHPESDLVLLVSDHVHAYAVRTGYLQLPRGEFRRVEVNMKEFHEPAWLWIA